MSERSADQRVLDILQDDDRMRRLEAAAELRDTAPAEAVEALVAHLDSPDATIRGRAGSVLSVFHESVGPRSADLVRHLRHSADPSVRLSCAILLMSSDAPGVADAYVAALRDPFDKVARVACSEVGHRGGAEGTAALFGMLDHPLWSVRLGVCKALIVLGAADPRVVATLEAMSAEPEAGEYDTLIGECEEIERQVREQYPADAGEDALGESWGTLATILEQARQVARAGPPG